MPACLADRSSAGLACSGSGAADAPARRRNNTLSPYRDVRQEVRQLVESDGSEFVEVYARCSLQELTKRDVKGLYEKALARSGYRALSAGIVGLP